MSDHTSKYAKNIERFRQAVFAHDRENEGQCVAWGIGLSRFDMDRLDLDEGELLWSEPTSITVHADDGVTGNFRVLCSGTAEHAGKQAVAETTRAVGVEA